MKNLFTIATLIAGTFMAVSCAEDSPIDPTKKELQQTVLQEITDEIAGIVSTDASADGMTTDEIAQAFGWTLTKGAETAEVSPERFIVTANIEQDTRWSNAVYQLDGRITVLDGITLTIEPGTRIEGNANLSGENAAVLMVARGGTLIAEGTADNPIIMTSTADDGTLDASAKGKWGGLVVLGKAPVSAKVDNPQIEGVPADDINGLYGGTDPNDNSGIIRYVSIRHGGAIIDAAAGDEINGLTLGGVGAGTTIEYVEIYANSDDGIEFFGGTVNVSYALVSQVGDDAIDIDQSYAGTVDKFFIQVDANSDEGLEIDGREGSLDDTFILTDGTIETVGEQSSITCDFKSKAKGMITNLNVNGGEIKLSASFDADDLMRKEDAAFNVVAGDLVFERINATFAVYTDSFDE